MTEPLGPHHPQGQASCRAVLAVRSVVRITLDASDSSGPNVEIDSVPIWGLNSIYLAARSNIEYGDTSNEAAWLAETEKMKSILVCFKSRWRLAGMINAYS
jgi:hypothetical protein